MWKEKQLKKKLNFLKNHDAQRKGLKYFSSLNLFASLCIFDKSPIRIEVRCICTCSIQVRVFFHFYYYYFSENLYLIYIAISGLIIIPN